MSSNAIILVEKKPRYWRLKGNQCTEIVNEFLRSQYAWNGVRRIM